MNHQPNIIALAVLAAGGGEAVSDEFGLGRATPFAWVRRGVIPSQYIPKLVEMGKSVITEKQIVDYVAQLQVEKMLAKKADRATKTKVAKSGSTGAQQQ